MSDALQDKPDTIEDREPPDDGGGLAELRSLILGNTDEQVERLRRQLDDPEGQADRISQALPRAIRLSAARDGHLAAALQPLTARTIRDSIKKDRQVFVDVLFPVMGPAIRKAIAATIQGLIQNFNQILEHSISIKGLRWRWEAWRTRRPFAEVVLLHTLVYQVEQVFLMHKASGLLIEHIVAKTAVAQNPDMVSGMLSAIKDFVQDSFGATQEDTLEAFQVGERKVWIEHGPHAIVALVISGNPSVHLKEMMRDALDEVHVNHFEQLKAFDGDTSALGVVKPILNGLLQVQFKSRPKRHYGAWIVMALLMLAIGWGLFHWLDHQRRWSRFVERLNAQPGIVVTQITNRDGRRHLYGLRDPLAPPSEQLMEGSRISSESVVFHWESYQSAHPEFAQQRLARLFKPPASVDLVLEEGNLRASGAAPGSWVQDARRVARVLHWIDGYDDKALVDIHHRLSPPDTVALTLEGQVLTATGKAPGEWIEQTRSVAESLPGIKAYDDQGLADADQLEWEALVQAVNGTVFYFEFARNTLIPGQQPNIMSFIEKVKKLMAFSQLLDRPIRIDIRGHADQVGDEATNLAISRSRAETFLDLLMAAHMDKTLFTVNAAGSREPVQAQSDEENQALNRRVIFRVQPVEP